MTKKLLPLGVATVLAASLVGCSNDAPAESPAETPTAAVPSSTVEASPLPTPPKLTKSEGVAKDITIVECPTTKGAVVAKGTAKNTAKERRDIVLILIWLKNDSGDPLGSGMAVMKDVGAGKTKEWTIKATLVDQADRCVTNATSGETKK